MTDGEMRAEMDAVRAGQQQDLREVLLAFGGPATAEKLGDEAVLSVWSVNCRLAERPDWFRRVGGDRWELVA